MERSTFLKFFFLLLTGMAIGETMDRILGTLGDSALLPCNTTAGNGMIQWLKDGKLVASQHSATLGPSESERFSVSDQGGLIIHGLLFSDEGIYLCGSSLLDSTVVKQNIELQVVSGPANLTAEIKPAAVLPNGTLFVQNGSTVLFKCSSKSHPSQSLSWSFESLASDNTTLASGNGSSLEFTISKIQPSYQGTHSCIAQNTLSSTTASQSTQLLVYYAPDRHPDCQCTTGNDSSLLLLNCSWDGTYPLPTLHWKEELDTQGLPVLNISENNNTLVVNLSRPQLHEGQTFKCTGYHPMSAPKEKSCAVTLRAPYPQGRAMRTAFEGSNVTLTCMEVSSLPLAKTTWRKTIRQEEIIPSSKYIISELGPTFSLTIMNISKQDEGVYFCRSENPLLVRELEVFLTVKSSATYAGGIVGTFIAVLIIGVGITVGISAYRNRDRICLGNVFGQTHERQNDILNLVDSDEDEIFEEPVSRITTTANGHTTSLVQIHRIPSSDHEDLGNTDTEAEERTQAPEEGLVPL
ncbi:V-set and immunoglobulin domain-containing protein 10 [Megalops cyprinoides]|uniref:V-set and immunoglobulin domain-containing protein 10 n=1 Tax=Megalops cyprinoides TaxID=118141 RepID=UPI0018648B7F|nr:V-set and immunoglobulin domain-containing protein 10 [Megalops cyprinoides]